MGVGWGEVRRVMMRLQQSWGVVGDAGRSLNGGSGAARQTNYCVSEREVIGCCHGVKVLVMAAPRHAAAFAIHHQLSLSLGPGLCALFDICAGLAC